MELRITFTIDASAFNNDRQRMNAFIESLNSHNKETWLFDATLTDLRTFKSEGSLKKVRAH